MPQNVFLVGLAPEFGRSQQKQYIMFYNTVVLASAPKYNGMAAYIPAILLLMP
jgi:hypothetical protein